MDGAPEAQEMFSFHRNHRLQGRDGEAWCSTLAGNCDTCCLSGVCVVPQPHPASRVLAALPLTTLWHTVFLQRRSRRDACAARQTVMPRLHSQSSVLHTHRRLSEETGCEGKWCCFSCRFGSMWGAPKSCAPRSA